MLREEQNREITKGHKAGHRPIAWCQEHQSNDKSIKVGEGPAAVMRDWFQTRDSSLSKSIKDNGKQFPITRKGVKMNPVLLN